MVLTEHCAGVPTACFGAKIGAIRGAKVGVFWC